MGYRQGDDTADHARVRQLNMAAVMRCLHLNGTLSRADVSKKLELTRSTVTNIVNELLRRRLVVETTLNRTGAGRPGLLLEINENGGFAVGVEIDVGRVAVIITNMKALILWEKTEFFPAGESEETVIRMAEGLVDEALEQGRAYGLRPLGIGVGVIGLVEVETGVLLHAPALGWSGVPIRAWLTQRFKLPVHVESEANAAAIGYSRYGEVAGSLHLIYLSIGAGMAGGLMLDGQIYRGSGGMAGHIGHIKIAGSGELCTCGKKGCLVSEIGERALLRQVQALVHVPNPAGVVPRTSLVDASGQRLCLEALCSAVKQDEDVQRIIDRAARTLGMEIANLINIFNPERIVLGGTLYPLFPVMLPAIRQCVREMVLPQMRANVAVDGAGRADAEVFGAAALVLEAVHSDPSKIT